MVTLAIDSELDRGPHAGGPERLCALTRSVRPVADLLRFVVGPDGMAVPDIKQKLPGRGVWVTATQQALTEAVKRKVFARSFKREVRLAADFVDATGRLLERSVLDTLAIAAKASLVVSGFAKVEAALSRDRVVALIHAREAAPDGVKKLDAAARRTAPGGSIAVVRILTMAQLDLALGRPNVVHAALLAGSSTDTFIARLRRWERFRTGDSDHKNDTAAGDSVPNLS